MRSASPRSSRAVAENRPAPRSRGPGTASIPRSGTPAVVAAWGAPARRLRAGDWSIQREVDLHGLRSDEAREALLKLIDESDGDMGDWRPSRAETYSGDPRFDR